MEILNNAINSLNPFRKAPKDSQPEYTPPAPEKAREIPPNREVFLAWEAPSRVFTLRDSQYYRKILGIVFVAAIILVIAGQFLFLALVVSITVLFYVLSSTPPEKVKHELDNYGVFYLGKQYYWKNLKFYFFTKEGGFDILNIDTTEPYPGRLIMLTEGVGLDKIKEVVSRYLPFREEPPHTVFDKAFKKVSDKLSI